MPKMPKFYLKKFYFKDYFLITLGLVLYAVGVIAFIVPGKMVTGGGVGIALLVEYATGIPLQYTNLVLNLILLTIAFKILGSRFLIKTLYAVIMLTILLGLARVVFKEGLIENEPMMSGIVGALLCGTGIGIVVSNGGSTGGMDIVFAIINKFKNMSFGKIMLVFDCFIISSSYFIFHDHKIVVASIIVLAVVTYTIDYIINDNKQSIQLLIFTHHYEKIATAINVEMKRGCTIIDGLGWYTQKPIKIIVVVTKRSEEQDLFKLIHAIDETAFISESTVRNAYGLGFNAMMKRK